MENTNFIKIFSSFIVLFSLLGCSGSDSPQPNILPPTPSEKDLEKTEPKEEPIIEPVEEPYDGPDKDFIQLTDTDFDNDDILDINDDTPMGPPLLQNLHFRTNSDNTGHLPININHQNLAVRWEDKREKHSFLQNIIISASSIFIVRENFLISLHIQTGKEQWIKQFHSITNIFLEDEKLYVEARGQRHTVFALDPKTGQLIESYDLQNNTNLNRNINRTIILHNQNIYYVGEDSSQGYAKYGLKDKETMWQAPSSDIDPNSYNYMTRTGQAIIAGNYLISYEINDYRSEVAALVLTNVENGEVISIIKDPKYIPPEIQGRFTSVTPPIKVGNDTILIHTPNRIICFDIKSLSIKWEKSGDFNQYSAVNNNGDIYIANANRLERISIESGKTENFIEGSFPYTGQIDLTNNLLFTSFENGVDAFDLTSGQKVWSHKGHVSSFAISEHSLVISTGHDLTTYDLLGDRDSDNIPDGWEFYFGHNLSSDIDQDRDNLSAIEEFNLGTHPLKKDTDSDGKTDGDEVNLLHTDPTKADKEVSETESSESRNYDCLHTYEICYADKVISNKAPTTLWHVNIDNDHSEFSITSNKDYLFIDNNEYIQSIDMKTGELSSQYIPDYNHTHHYPSYTKMFFYNETLFRLASESGTNFLDVIHSDLKNSTRINFSEWSRQFYYDTPIIYKQHAFVKGTTEEPLMHIDLNSQEVTWTLSAKDHPLLSWNNITFHENDVYLGENSLIYQIDIDSGEVKNTHLIGTEASNMKPLISSNGDFIYLTPETAKRTNIVTDETIWSNYNLRAGGSYRIRAILANEHIYLLDRSSLLHIYNASTGEALLTPVDKRIEAYDIIATKNQIILTYTESTFAIDLQTYEVVWELQHEGNLHNLHLTPNELLIIYDFKGITAFTLQ